MPSFENCSLIYNFSLLAKLAPQPPKDENPFWDGTPALQPESETIFLYYDEEGEIRSRTLGDDEGN